MPDLLRDQLQTSLGTAYTLRRELGGGGMSRVFVAHEEALGRDVVVKVLSPELAQGISAERFAREIRLAASLQQANIVPVHVAAETDGLPFYTMPFVDGLSLRGRLERNGALPTSEAISVLRDVARALAYAHERGVVHRDIKPENILLSGGAAVVTDFGIAKALSASRSQARGNTLTQAGTSIGTPAYMAPEQAAGDSDVDHRADLYAWGIVAWELIAGRHPFASKPTPQALFVAHLIEMPASLAEQCPDLPAHVADVVMRCVAKDPAERPASAAEVLRALDAVDSLAQAPSRGRSASSSEGSVAVLPFTNLSADQDDEYFSDGMTEEVINALARRPGMRVAARTSSFVFKGQQKDLRTIGEHLGVATLLEGSVRRAGRRVRVSTQLASAADGLHLWSARYDRELTDVFALQDEIAEAIAQALGERLVSDGGAGAAGAPHVPQAVTRGVVSSEAYEQYLRGRFLFEQRGANLTAALEHFSRATQLAPDFADAHSWVGLTCSVMAVYGLLPTTDGSARARAAADRALVLDPAHVHALTVRVLIARWFDWDLTAAEDFARRAVAVGDGMAVSHEQLGWVLLAAEQFDEADAEMERALTLDPLSATTVTARAFSQIIGLHPDAALSTVDDWLARWPLDAEAHRLRGLALEAADRPHEACTAFRRAGELDPTNRFVAGDLAATLAIMGETDEARRIVGEMEQATVDSSPPAMMLALVHHALGESALAFAWLERALEAREFWLSMMHVDPMFRRMYEDPRFEALVRRVGVARVG